MKSKISFSFQASSLKRLSFGSAWITGDTGDPSALPIIRRAVFCHSVM